MNLKVLVSLVFVSTLALAADHESRKLTLDQCYRFTARDFQAAQANHGDRKEDLSLSQVLPKNFPTSICIKSLKAVQSLSGPIVIVQTGENEATNYEAAVTTAQDFDGEPTPGDFSYRVTLKSDIQGVETNDYRSVELVLLFDVSGGEIKNPIIEAQFYIDSPIVKTHPHIRIVQLTPIVDTSAEDKRENR